MTAIIGDKVLSRAMNLYKKQMKESDERDKIKSKIDYYGIQTPEGKISWIGHSDYQAWEHFFYFKPHRLPLHEAKEAYKAIGYKCVALEIKIIKEI